VKSKPKLQPPVQKIPQKKKPAKHGAPAMMDKVLDIVDKTLPKDDEPTRKNK
jgi:hypothetical protein